MPYRWTADERLHHRTDWLNSDIMQTGDVRECFERVKEGVDELLKGYGYIHENGFFRVEGNARRAAVVVCFCHFAVTSAVMSYLLNMSFPDMVHGFFMPTTSVTVLATEERREGEAYFRTQLLGDTYHLRRGGEPISHSGYFGDIFMG